MRCPTLVRKARSIPVFQAGISQPRTCYLNFCACFLSAVTGIAMLWVMRATLEMNIEVFVRIALYWRGMRTALGRKYRLCICVLLAAFCREMKKRVDTLCAPAFSVGGRRKVEGVEVTTEVLAAPAGSDLRGLNTKFKTVEQLRL